MVCWEQYSTSPGVNIPQDTNYMATCLPSRKLYKLDEPYTQDTSWEARKNLSGMYSYGPPHMAKQKQNDQLEHTYSSYVRIRDVTLNTCQKRWMIGRSGERGSGISVLAARLDDDDDDQWFKKDFLEKFWNDLSASEVFLLVWQLLDLLAGCFFFLPLHLLLAMPIEILYLLLNFWCH